VTSPLIHHDQVPTIAWQTSFGALNLARRLRASSAKCPFANLCRYAWKSAESLEFWIDCQFSISIASDPAAVLLAGAVAIALFTGAFGILTCVVAVVLFVSAFGIVAGAVAIACFAGAFGIFACAVAVILFAGAFGIVVFADTVVQLAETNSGDDDDTGALYPHPLPNRYNKHAATTVGPSHFGSFIPHLIVPSVLNIAFSPFTVLAASSMTTRNVRPAFPCSTIGPVGPLFPSIVQTKSTLAACAPTVNNKRDCSYNYST
jgi:hypothetical protein